MEGLKDQHHLVGPLGEQRVPVDPHRICQERHRDHYLVPQGFLEPLPPVCSTEIAHPRGDTYAIGDGISGGAMRLGRYVNVGPGTTFFFLRGGQVKFGVEKGKFSFISSWRISLLELELVLVVVAMTCTQQEEDGRLAATVVDADLGALFPSLFFPHRRSGSPSRRWCRR